MARVGRSALAALAVGQLLVGFDGAVATVAMPSMQRDLSLDAGTVQLTMSAYLVAAAALALPLGALGDRVGRRPVYVVGLVLFGLGSLLCAAAATGSVLVAGRAVAGVGAAAMTVLSLAILTADREGDDVARVVGYWTALTSAALTAAPMVGGLVVQTIGWRAMFAVNVPVVAVLVVVIASRLHADPAGGSGRVDVLGSALVLAATVAVVGSISMADEGGQFDVASATLLAVGLVLLGVLVVQQRRTRVTITDWNAIGRPPLPWLLVVRALVALAVTGAMFQQTLLVQDAFDFSPALAGALDIGPAVVFVILAAQTGRILRHWTVTRVMVVGLGCSAAGMIGVALADDVDPSPVAIATLFLLLGAGMGLIVPTLSAAAVGDVPPQLRGAVSGFLSMAAQLAAVLGMATMGLVAAEYTRIDWVGRVGDTFSGDGPVAAVVAGAISTVRDQYGSGVAAQAALAYTGGVQAALVAGAVLLAVTAVLVLLVRPERLGGDAPGA